MAILCLTYCTEPYNLEIFEAGNLDPIYLKQQGRLNQAVEICQQQLQLANENGMGHTPVVGWLLAIWGEVLAE